MTFYKCKCGAVQSKSSNADNTGNRDTEYCKGCPYLLPYGELEHVKGKGIQLKVKGYECRMSQELEYASRFGGSVTDKCTCYVASLDYDFLQQISDWIRETYPNGELNGGFSRERVRSTDFSSSGRYRYSIWCSQNKAGMAAKAALLERFFNPDGSRKDMTPEEEKEKILAGIEKGKRAAKEAEKASCLCLDCANKADCDGCYGDCDYCHSPTDNCTDFKAWGKEELATIEATIPMEETIPAPAEPAESTPAPAFDYSGLDEQTATRLQNLERRALECKQRYALDMMEIVFEAHRELVQPRLKLEASSSNGWTSSTPKKHANQYSEATFIAWCARIGVSKTTAYNLLQVQALMDNSSPEEQEVLENAPAKLLYAAARPSAPAELVEQVKSGDITTHKQYQELLAELKKKEDALQKKDAALKQAQELAEDRYRQAVSVEEDWKVEKTARQTLEALRDQLLTEQDEHLARIAELEARPIEATAATEEEIARWREEGAKREAEARDGAYQAVCAERDKANEKAEKAQREARRLRETLEGRTDHLNAVEAELKNLKAKIADAQNALPRLPGPHTTAAPPSAPIASPPGLVLCRQCVYEPICCGIRFLDEDDMSEEMYAGFAGLDEDAFDARLVGCTAGQTKESR